MGEFSSIKKIFVNFVLCTITILLVACARPEVVKITSPEDPLMNCDELELSVVEAQKFKRDALYEKDNTGGNVARMMLFWPAMATTYHNADVAIKAANDRTYHLLHLMKQKDCKGVDLVNAELIRTATETVVGQLQAAKEMYESGHLTKEEYTKAKKKILD